MKKADWEIRHAVRDDLKYLDGANFGSSARVWVMEVEGVVAGLGGVVLEAGRYTVFVKVVDDSLVRKVGIARAMKIGFREIIKMKLPILYAIRDREIGTSERLLDAFGFEHKVNIGNEEIYQWHQRY